MFDGSLTWAWDEIEVIALERIVSFTQFPVCNDSIFCASCHSFEEISVLRVLFDEFSIMKGRHSQTFVTVSIECFSFMLDILNVVLLIVGGLIYELHCDHFIWSCRVRIRNALLKLTALKGELRVVLLFLRFDQIFNIFFACLCLPHFCVDERFSLFCLS